MQGGLVGAQFDMDVLFGKLFPQVDNIALVGQRNRLLVASWPASAGR